MLKKLLKGILPLPYNRTNERFEALEAELKRNREMIESLQGKLDQLNKLDKLEADARDTLIILRSLQPLIQDSRVTEINIEKAVHSSTRDLIHLIEELSDDLQRLEGLWQSETISRRESLDEFYLVKHIRRLRHFR